MVSVSSKRLDHLKAEERYKAYRELVYENTMSEFPGVTVKGIEFVDCVTADKWKNLESVSNRPYSSTWEWTKEYPFYKNRPKRFEISLWGKGILCALCYGQISKHGPSVRMNLIESIPLRPSPLGRKALPVLAFSAASFADVVGATELWVLDPDPNLERTYMKEGFGHVERYHGRRVGQRRIL